MAAKEGLNKKFSKKDIRRISQFFHSLWTDHETRMKYSEYEPALKIYHEHFQSENVDYQFDKRNWMDLQKQQFKMIVGNYTY